LSTSPAAPQNPLRSKARNGFNRLKKSKSSAKKGGCIQKNNRSSAKIDRPAIKILTKKLAHNRIMH